MCEICLSALHRKIHWYCGLYVPTESGTCGQEVMAKVDAKVGSSTVYFISEARPKLHESKGDSDTEKDKPQMTGTQYSRNKKAWDV